jgi:hypothetical protein
VREIFKFTICQGNGTAGYYDFVFFSFGRVDSFFCFVICGRIFTLGKKSRNNKNKNPFFVHPCALYTRPSLISMRSGLLPGSGWFVLI